MAEEENRENDGVVKFRRGLAFTLFIWFMVLSLGPLGIVGFNEYKEAKATIVSDQHEQLSTINLLLTQRVNDYFDTVITNLFIKSSASERFISKMIDEYQTKNIPPAEYINSPSYQTLYDQYSSEYIDFLRFYDYSDVLLGDAQGNILYTVNGYEDLGQNLFDGDLSDTSFAKATRQSMDKQSPVYADLGEYSPVGGERVSFFVLPLTNEHQEAVGFIAVQIHSNNIQSLFEGTQRLGSGQISYLVGVDSKVRFGSGLSTSEGVIDASDNPLVGLWLSHLDQETGLYSEDDEYLGHFEGDSHGDHGGHDEEVFTGEFSDVHAEESEVAEMLRVANKAGESHIRTYTSFTGERVLGIYLPVRVSGTAMAMISEVSQFEAFASVIEFRDRMTYLIAAMVLMVMVIAILVSRKLVMPLRTINNWVNKVASGVYVEGAVLSGQNEIGQLSRSFSRMTNQLRTINEENEQRSWLQNGMEGLNNSVRGDKTMADLCREIVSYLAHYLDMQTGAMYVLTEQEELQLMGSYAWRQRKQSDNKFALGDGLVGQAALERQTIELTNVPDHYLDIESGLGSTKPAQVIIVPLIYENQVKGVIEFAYIRELTDQQRQFLDYSVESVSIAISSAQNRSRVKMLLDKTTQQTEAMTEQQEELKAVNDELGKRALILEESEEELKAQSDELQKSNAELEEKSELLTQQKEEIERKNQDIEQTSKRIEEKAQELEQASKYKSEFLANMSHELRTPLNSLLLLAQMLADNDEGNLTEDQIESAQVIHSGGKELLGLINDILDLSKVEAGKMSVNLEDTNLDDVCMSICTMFNPLAESRNLEFAVEIEAGTTQVILSDSQRLLQIIKNFLSNAFKFTSEGGVYVRIFKELRSGLYGDSTHVGFAVRDTGIGIPKDKQDAIFESFQQADGSTSRKYGGTGLGLAISREMAGLLGGFIEITSEEGEGTTFTLFLPDNAVCSLSNDKVLADSFSSAVSDGQTSNKGNTQSGRVEPPAPKPQPTKKITPKLPPMSARSMLLIEDDKHFTDILEQVAHKNKFEFAHAGTGKEGLELAKRQPAAIILDLGLPDMDGHEVLRALKASQETKDIPVHIISGRDPDSDSQDDAVGYLVKPVTVADLDKVFMTLETAIKEGINEVLILDLDAEARMRAGTMLEKKGMNVSYADTPETAFTMLQTQQWQCLVMDLDLGDTEGLAFLDQLKQSLGDNMPSVVIQMARELSKEEHLGLQEYTSTMVVKGEMSSERMMDEVSLFLHSVEKKSPEVAEKKPVASGSEKNLEGHKILLVDDDLRNTFALSKALQGQGLEVVIADNGQSALDRLEEESGIELILMDVMMPVMDGYEATRQLRQMDEFKDLPVISLTAKAMSDDRAKCLEAGANDYMTKPVDMDQLIEMLKVWLFK
ncbi:hypothetical protein ACH42_08780 [Endozoicomonas sp. (ex Bugula neritina AB1)]|nr:hypothetical protein ACH42_08780 [Endozoicomonas sp. (ex Bugula neritina AB1)]